MQIRMTGALLSAIMLIAGASTKATAQRRYSESLDTTVTIDRQATVDLSLFSGRVDIAGGSGTQAHVRASTDRGGIDFDAVFRGLHEIGYTGYFTVHSRTSQAFPPRDLATRSFEFLKPYSDGVQG